MVVMLLYHIHNYFRNVQVAHMKQWHLSLSQLFLNFPILKVFCIVMNEFTFRVLKAAICAAASYVAGKAFENATRKIVK